MANAPSRASMGGDVANNPQLFKLLVVSLEPDHDLENHLVEFLEPVQEIRLSRCNLAGAAALTLGKHLQDRLNKFQPTLLFYCVKSGAITDAQLIFDVVQKHQPHLPIMLLLDSVEADDLHHLMAMGAVDFTLKPLRLEDLLPRLSRWHRASAQENQAFHKMKQRLGMSQFIGESQLLMEVITTTSNFARCDASALITGETGTGKEMFARAIHYLGPRSSRPFIPVNCGAIPSELIENELFGHEKGAFTGALSKTSGLIQEAEGGTLFLDEIDSLPTTMQVKLLRFLQDKEYRPLGGGKARRADIRIIAASNVEMEMAVHAGRFRADLFYRLNVLRLKLPPLRERREDIPALTMHFLSKYAGEFRLPMKGLGRAAVEKLMAYDWPGNVRELENVIERALVVSEWPVVAAQDICLPETAGSCAESSFKKLKARAIAQFEISFIRHLLTQNDGNISKAARAAQKNRRAFWQLMRKHEIAVPRPARLNPVGQNPAFAMTNLS
jgi:two-component system, NtrC family, response regulator GlrR